MNLRGGQRHALHLLTLLVILVIGAVVESTSASAHAELIEADPPIDGLVVASPNQLTLTFSEDVAASNPVPSVRVLNDQGQEQGTSANPPQGRQLIVDLELLPPGIWTVEWSVRSATDGHTLSGTYAFRIGGGLPAGAATVSGETPAVWAVIARWLTFFGAAIAAAGFAFGLVESRSRIPANRLVAIVVAALIGLLASLAEPVMQVFYPPGDASISFASSLRSLPDAWWIRPPTLAISGIIASSSYLLLKRRLPHWMAGIGTVASLAALLGLSLTSHAAGRETWREVAVAIDIFHQWSVALWVGGLVHLVLAWPFSGSAEQSVSMRRFSRLALGLFVISIASGVANAGFVFPALDSLWNSRYGSVLIVKLVLLLLPFALAIYHRRVIAAAKQLPKIVRTTMRLEVAAVAAVLIGGATLALSAPPIEEKAGPDNVTLFQFDKDSGGETVGLVHLRIAPVEPGDNEITVWTTDLEGNRPSAESALGVSLVFTSLDHGIVSESVELVESESNPLDLEAGGFDLSLEGWWQIDASVTRDSGRTSASFYVLLPDPNIHGRDAAPTPDEDAEARAVYDRAISTMQSSQALSWSESINTGDDTMVQILFDQIVATSDRPLAVEQVLAFSGSFTPRSDGPLPPAPTMNTYHSVMIGEQSWLVQDESTWLSQPAARYGSITEWGSIYQNAEYLKLGDIVQIDGRLTQLISFHTPDQPGQSEAWFIWWVDVGSGEVKRVAMVASSHYMVWTYLGFGDEVVITQPPAGLLDPAIPEATPAT
ncbi:MAG: copper resistance protein CopC [Thermomicrobiales bacterium]